MLTPEVQALLGQANYAYVSKDYKTAVDVFQQVIVKNPSVFQAWNSMGLIQEELGNIEKALQLFMVAAHLTPKDGALWKKLAVISKYVSALHMWKICPLLTVWLTGSLYAWQTTRI